MKTLDVQYSFPWLAGVRLPMKRNKARRHSKMVMSRNQIKHWTARQRSGKSIAGVLGGKEGAHHSEFKTIAIPGLFNDQALVHVGLRIPAKIGLL